MYIRSFTWCLLHLPSSVLQGPSSNIRKNTGMYFQEPHLGVMHLPSSVLHILSCKSGASHGVLYMLTCALNMPSCTSEASLGCTPFAIKCTAEAIILHQGVLQEPHLISYHVNQEPHMVSSEAYKFRCKVCPVCA